MIKSACQKTLFFIKILALVTLFPHISVAEEIAQPNHFSFYVGKYADTNLRTVVPKLVTADLDLKDPTILSLGYFRDVYSYSLGSPDKLRLGYGGTLSTHAFDNLEITGNLSLTLMRILPENQYLNMDFMVAVGLSSVLGNLAYEDGTKEHPNKKYHFQNSDIFQLNIYSPKHPHLKTFVRLHHRSGIYGLVAPRHVGSNFLGVGVSWGY